MNRSPADYTEVGDLERRGPPRSLHAESLAQAEQLVAAQRSKDLRGMQAFFRVPCVQSHTTPASLNVSADSLGLATDAAFIPYKPAPLTGDVYEPGRNNGPCVRLR